MDDKPLQALANELKTPAQESQRKGFFRLQQVKKNLPPYYLYTRQPSGAPA
ncbi:hypothetical protein ACFDC9_03940 [Escherichia coli]|uniref:Uncharacterized protein n=1 Tax=Escherichia coli TaxID=562 RepID=A0A828LAR5_ECOLX|nr:hypothetical protein [Escherichia coli]EFE9629678.1 hypothetical protein [Escherichia coli]EFF2146024.1 hypothetical protein [Escherichia coli]EFF2193993.1 hypothetical protein [Escherichia coli]EFG3070455.1 hypothetical protein [Escherichia coli]EFG9296578.1 hypothetical protein [Escherichia coli]